VRSTAVPIHVFVAHAFAGRGSVSADDLRAAANEVFAGIPKLNLPGGDLGVLQGFFVAQNYGEPLPSEVREALMRADVAIVDLTGLRPNVLFELGFLAARGSDLILIAQDDGSSAFQIPADIKDLLVGFYSNADELKELLRSRLTDVVTSIARDGSIPSRSAAAVWFDLAAAASVSIVCSPEPEKTRFANRSDPNYLFIDNLEDRDSLVEASLYLARTYPNSQAIRYSSDAIPPDVLNSDLVVIGGPGEPGGPGNHIARDVLERVRTRVAFADNCESATCDGTDYTPDLAPDGTVRSDYAYVLRCRNPYSARHSLILMCGVYTVGTLGAVLAFGDHPRARMNSLRAQTLSRSKPGTPLEFEAFFKVDASPSGSAVCPSVSKSEIRHLLEK
jgi:hypothetical protein